MPSPLQLSLAALAAGSANAFLIPSTLSAPDVSVSSLKDIFGLPGTAPQSHAVYHSTMNEGEKIGLNITISPCQKSLRINNVSVYPRSRRVASAPIISEEVLMSSRPLFDTLPQHSLSYMLKSKSEDDEENQFVDLDLHVLGVDDVVFTGQAKAETTMIRLKKSDDGKISFEHVFLVPGKDENDGDSSDEEDVKDADDEDLAESFKFLPFVPTTPRVRPEAEASLEGFLKAFGGREHGKHGHAHHEHDKEESHGHHHDHHHHRHPQELIPHAAFTMGCDEKSNALSKAFCHARAFFRDTFTLVTHPTYGPRRFGECHKVPSPDGTFRTECVKTPSPIGQWIGRRPGCAQRHGGNDKLADAGLVPPPSFPEGFPKPKGGPLKFLPRPHGPPQQNDVVEGDHPEPPRDWEAYYGRPHHHHSHHHHHSPILSAFHWVVFSIIIPIFIGVAAGVLASAVGMIVGTAVAWAWIRFVRGNKRGGASKAVVEEGDAALAVRSEKEKLLAAEGLEKAKEAEVEVEEVEVVEPPPVYVEKA